jgi:hypothetical protein
LALFPGGSEVAILLGKDAFAAACQPDLGCKATQGDVRTARVTVFTEFSQDAPQAAKSG